jgi:hypothetical protein
MYSVYHYFISDSVRHKNVLLLYVHRINICFICNSLPLRGPLFGTITLLLLIIIIILLFVRKHEAQYVIFMSKSKIRHLSNTSARRLKCRHFTHPRALLVDCHNRKTILHRQICSFGGVFLFTQK